MERFKVIPMGDIIPSETNPRGEIDLEEKDFLELAESIAVHGVIQPISVRPFEGKYKIIFGERRYRAADFSNLEEIPCFIRELDDNAALELQLIENLQRKDIHPLNEAEGFKRLLDTGRYDQSLISAKLGKDITYVYKRLKLNDLIDEAKEAFRKHEIFLGHALILARHDEKLQQSLFKFITNTWNGEKRTINELKQHIESNFMLQLKSVPWNLKDKELTKAGSCIDCPKRTGYNEHLFPEYADDDKCTDKKCFGDKLTAHIYLQIDKHREKGEELLILKSWGDVPKQFKEEALQERNDFKPFDGKVHKGALKKLKKKGIYINGDAAGQIINIILTKDLPEDSADGSDDDEFFPNTWQKIQDEEERIEEFLKPTDEQAKGEIYTTTINEVEELKNNELAIVAVTLILENYYNIDTSEMNGEIVSAFELPLEINEQNKRSTKQFSFWYPELAKLNRLQLTQIIIRVLLLSHRADDEYSSIVSSFGIDVNKIKSKYLPADFELGKLDIGASIHTGFDGHDAHLGKDITIKITFTREAVDLFSSKIKLQLPYKEWEDDEETINKEYILSKTRTLKLAILNAQEDINQDLSNIQGEDGDFPQELKKAIASIKTDTEKFLEQYC